MIYFCVPLGVLKNSRGTDSPAGRNFEKSTPSLCPKQNQLYLKYNIPSRRILIGLFLSQSLSYGMKRGFLASHCQRGNVIHCDEL